MKLFQALKLIRDRKLSADGQAAGSTLSYDLICGFTPLHLRTFVNAALLQRSNDSVIDVEIGLFGDLLGNIERISNDLNEAAELDDRTHAGVAVVIEWSDLDPRLGLRATHGWRPDRADDILNSVQLRLGQLSAAISGLTGKTAVAVSLPSLPLPPMFVAPTTITTPVAARLRSCLHEFAATLADAEIRVLDEQTMNMLSPLADRLDVKSELRSGFPFQMNHAWFIAEQFASLLVPQAMLKGIITDLDNTLWAGIVGEDGIDSVSWDLDHKTQHHGLYQEQLASLAESGTLVAIASKNDSSVVQQAIQRDDLIIDKDRFFPIEANWGAKSESIARILTAWNIGPDAVMFIDDRPIELAEVASAFPEMVCRSFPTDDPAAVLELLTEIRDRFGRLSISEEDKLRAQSLRAAVELKQPDIDPEAFLASAEAHLSLTWNQPDARALELLNKTNQFNLNGRRVSDAEWHRLVSDPSSFLLTVSYKDKFAPLGKIAIALGRASHEGVVISAWVMSCRAFSRRIEHGTLQAIFDRFNCSEIALCFEPTERNGPLQTTLSELHSTTTSIAESPQPEFAITTINRSDFRQHSPRIYFEVSSHDNERNSISA
jgi:FkbH-like protein